jgi:hypothetical protein
MKPTRQLLTVMFVLMFPACAKDSITVGGIPGTGGSATVPPSTGGATTAPLAAGGTSGAGGGLDGAAGTGLPCLGPTLVASEANNYNIASSLGLVAVTVKGLADLTFDWSNATVDLRGRTMVPATDIAMVSVWVFNLNLKGLQTKLNNDSLMQVDLAVVPLVYYPDGGRQTAKLSEFTLNGTAVDFTTLLAYFDPAAYPVASSSYAMMVSSSKTLGQDTLMIQAFQLDSAATSTTIAMGPDSTSLTIAADLRSLTPTAVPVGRAALSLDFGWMSKNAMGFDWYSSAISSAVIGRYTQSLAELEGSAFPNLDRVAAELFQGKVTTTSVDLATLQTAGGKSFAGIDDTSTWLLGLLCDSCSNPAPWYITVLRPCGLTY